MFNLINFLIVLAICIIPNYLFPATRGTVIFSQKFHSKILKADVKFSVYLPPDYQTSDKEYPVFYLLHGHTDDETTWIKNGWVDYAADETIQKKEAISMIIVMPDAGFTWYVNDYKDKFRFEDMFIKEFIPYIDKTFRTKKNKNYRAIGGLSMGGYGSLGLAMRHPDSFLVCTAFSAAIWTDDEIKTMPDERYNELFLSVFGEHLRGKNRLTKYWYKMNPLFLAKTLPNNVLKRVNWLIDCGDDDIVTIGNATLHIILKQKNIAHEYRVRDGRHNWIYWRESIKYAIRFISNIMTLNAKSREPK